MTTAAEIVQRRRAGRSERLDRARTFAKQLPADLAVVAVVVFGSVARGDWNVWSDIDVLVVADHAPATYRERLEALGEIPVGIEPVVWTSDEWCRQQRRRNPIAVEVAEDGVWLVGSRDDLA